LRAKRSNPWRRSGIASAFALRATADKSSLQRKIALQFCRELLAMTGRLSLPMAAFLAFH
jgi:hypothetical protein